MGIFGSIRNSRKAIVLGIKIAVVYSNTNLLFVNSDNIFYYVVPRGR
jgi:hypothetical protein